MSTSCLTAWLRAMAVLLCVCSSTHGYRSPGPTFGTAMKSCYQAPGTSSCVPWPFGQELPVFEHTCANVTSSLCIMRHFWSGGSWPGYEHTRLKYYVDGEATPSVSFPIGLGHGSTMSDDNAPWSAGGIFGQTGSPSGIFNTYAIPFASTVRVTVTLLDAPSSAVMSTPAAGGRNKSTSAVTPPSPSLPPHKPSSTSETRTFWIILRGHTLLNTPVEPAMSSRGGESTLPLTSPNHNSNPNPNHNPNPNPLQFTLPGSGMALPASARLKTHENVDVALAPGEYLDLVVSTASAGTVYMVSLAVESDGSETFLEGCLRVTDPVTKTTRMLLSSGTEDYFLGTYYFNRGKYTNELAGLTSLDKDGHGTNFSAYRLHSDDPLTWGSGGFRETWRNGDPEGCVESATPGAPNVKASSVTFYYEW